jgi:hypothetical protein
VQEACVARGMVADVAIHEGHHAHAPNPHAHILLTTRTIGPQGFGKKDRTWNASDLVIDWRQAWEQAANAALAQAGHTAHIDARSHEARHLAELPTVHEGPHVTAMAAKGIPTDRRDLNDTIRAHNALLADVQIAHAEAAAARAEQQLKEEKAIEARRRRGWTDKEIAAQQRLKQQHMTLGNALTQALQGLAVDPLVLSLAKARDPAADFHAQWQDADGRTLRQLEGHSHSSYDYPGIVQHWEQQLTQAARDVQGVSTFFGRIFHADRIRAARGREAEVAQHLADSRHEDSAHQAHVQHYQEAVQTAEADWQSWQPHVEQTRTALSEAYVLGTITLLMQAEQEQQHSQSMELFRHARTISLRILYDRIADWHTPDVLTRFVEQISPTVRALRAEREAAQEREATIRALEAQARQPVRNPKKAQEQELEL